MKIDYTKKGKMKSAVGLEKNPKSVFENLLRLLCAFFWVIPWRLNFICRRFGTLCSIFIGS
jgi:hypothetical protein